MQVRADHTAGATALVAALAVVPEACDDPTERLYDAMIAVAEKRLDKTGLAALLAELSTSTA